MKSKPAIVNSIQCVSLCHEYMVAPRSCDLLESQLNIDCGKMSQIHSFSMEFNERPVGPHIELIQHTNDTPMIVIRDLIDGQIEQVDNVRCIHAYGVSIAPNRSCEQFRFNC